MLKLRIITAIVLLLIVSGAIFGLSYTLFQGFLALVLALAAWEWGALAGFDRLPLRLSYCVFILIGFYFGILIPESSFKLGLMANLAGWIIISLSLYCYPKYSRIWGSKIFVALCGFFLLIPCWLSVLYLRAQTNFTFLILMLLALVAAADIGAYFSGRAFGKHKLAPQVSPNKTWEGVWGGMLACSLLVLATAIYRGLSVSWPALIGCTVALAAFSVEGDLLESMLKRIKGVKDSGSILPGHGGVLDRIDGMIATAPLYVFFLMSFGVEL